MDGNRGGGRHIRQCATVIPAVFFIRVCNVEPGYRATGAHVRLHAGTESKNCVEAEVAFLTVSRKNIEVSWISSSHFRKYGK